MLMYIKFLKKIKYCSTFCVQDRWKESLHKGIGECFRKKWVSPSVFASLNHSCILCSTFRFVLWSFGAFDVSEVCIATLLHMFQYE